MTHVLILMAKVRRNEQFWQTLYIGNMFMPTFGFKIHNNYNWRNKITQNFTILVISIFLHMKQIAPPYTSPNMIGAEPLKWSLMRTSTLEQFYF
jgi:hypothetical protein